MGELVKSVDVAIANEEDCQKALGVSVPVDVESGKLDAPAVPGACGEGALHVSEPQDRSPSRCGKAGPRIDNGWSGVLHTGKEFLVSRHYEIRDIVDRVGSGDSFAAGLIYGLTNLASPQEALEFAVAASCLKHSIPGDLPLLSVAEVKALMGGSGSGRVQR